MRSFAEIPTAELTENFNSHLVDKDTPGWRDEAIARLNREGLVTFRGIETSEELAAMAGLFGVIRRYDLTDSLGVTTMATGDAPSKGEGTVVNPQSEQPLHTDGSTVPDPPDLGFIYCETPDPYVQRASVFGSGKKLYEQLADEDSELLELLHQPVDCGDTTSGLFTRHPSGVVSVRLRPVDPVMDYPPEVLAEVDARLHEPDLLTGVTFGRGEGVIFNNKSLFHGVGATEGSGRIAKRAIVTADPDLGILPGFVPNS